MLAWRSALWMAALAAMLLGAGCRQGDGGGGGQLPPEAAYREEEEPVQPPAGVVSSAPNDESQPPKPAIRLPPQATENKPPSNVYADNDYAVRLMKRDFVRIENSAGALDLNGDFTIECWIKAENVPEDIAGDVTWPAPGAAAGPNQGWAIRGLTTKQRGYRLEFSVATVAGAWITVVGESADYPQNPHHIAVCRSGDELLMFINGKLAGRQKTSEPFAASSAPICLGVAENAPEDHSVRTDIHSFRIAAGARYKEDFQPSLLESDDQTLVLIDFSAGNTDDLSGHARNGQCYGPEWISMTILAEYLRRPLVAAQRREHLARVSLGEAFRSYDAAGSTTPTFSEYLIVLREQFPSIEPATGDEKAKWATFTLNQSGARLDAVRFQSPLSTGAGMRWSFVVPAGRIRSWYILPAKGLMVGFQNFFPELFVDFDDLDEPADNIAYFQTLAGGISPGQEYILWFTFADERPVALSAAIQLAPPWIEDEGPFSSEQIASAMGFSMPLGRASLSPVDELTARARYRASHDLEGALAMVEEGLAREPKSRPLLLVAIEQTTLRARQRASRVGDKIAAPLFLKAGEYGRTLRNNHQDLDPWEKTRVMMAARAEARGHAMLGDSTKAIASLQDAVAAGLASGDELESDDELSALRGSPEFEKFVADLRLAAGPWVNQRYDLQVHPSDAVQHEGHWFKFFPGQTPWAEAHARCQALGGYLACGENPGETQFMKTLAPEGNTWMGGVKTTNGAWLWITGESVHFARWSDGEPAAAGGQDDKIKLNSDGKCGDAAADDRENRGFICEWER